MSHNKMRSYGASKMDGPNLIYTATSQASAAGGLTPYVFASCFGAKALRFYVRTAVGVPNISTGTVIDISPGAGMAVVTGLATQNYGLEFVAESNGVITVVPANNTNLYGATNMRIMVDSIRPRVQLAISATGVSCWSVVQWD